MNATYRLIQSADSSATLYNAQYDESYHATNEGALTESLHKHVRPAIALGKLLARPTLRILDICFGLGYNMLCSLYELQNRGFAGQIAIYSPEKDAALLQQCASLRYPEALHPFLPILRALCDCGFYESPNLRIELHIGDARDYLRELSARNLCFDVIYQDPFSPPKNPELWNRAHFEALFALLAPSGILTTYSQSARALYTAHCCGFATYKCANAHGRDFSICSKAALESAAPFALKPIDWNHKLQCNPALIPF